MPDDDVEVSVAVLKEKAVQFEGAIKELKEEVKSMNLWLRGIMGTVLCSLVVLVLQLAKSK